MTINQTSTSDQEAMDEIDVRSLIDQCGEENIIGLHSDTVQFNETKLKDFMCGHCEEFKKLRDFCGVEE